jgi:hypothetical protein
MKNLIFIFLFFKTTFCIAQNGIGFFPVLDNYKNRRSNGYDTTGLSLGKKPTYLFSPRMWRPKLRPTFFVTNKSGDRINEFSLEGRFFHSNTLEWANITNYYKRELTYNWVVLNANKNVRLWQSPNEKFQFWTAINRGLYIEHYKSLAHYGADDTFSEKKEVSAIFSISPSFQYKYSNKLNFVLLWENPSFWTLGLSKTKDNLPSPFPKIKPTYNLLTSLQIALVRPKLNHNLRFGVRYTLNSNKKTEILPIKKPQKWKKTDWGVGLTAGFYSAKPAINSTFTSDNGLDGLNIRPMVSFYQLSNKNRNLREIYASDFIFDREKSSFWHHYKLNDTIASVLVHSQVNTSRILFGFGNYKKVDWLSNGKFSTYTGTRFEYIYTSFREFPTESLGFQESYKLRAFRIGFTINNLFKIDDKWQIETRILPFPYLQLGWEKKTKDNPLYSPANTGWELQNNSNFDIPLNILLGVKYKLKTTKIKNK